VLFSAKSQLIITHFKHANNKHGKPQNTHPTHCKTSTSMTDGSIMSKKRHLQNANIKTYPACILLNKRMIKTEVF
jgi:hypothetical protein